MKFNNKNLIKTIIVFITYLIYVDIFSFIGHKLNINNDIIISFISDMIYLVFIVFLYKDDIKNGMDVYHKDNAFKSRILKVVCWVIIIGAANVLGQILQIILSNTYESSNNVAVLSLPYFYTLFKTVIFSSIAEELVVKQSIRYVIDNNLLFIVISTLIYSAMNVAYTDLSGTALIANTIPYALFAIATGILYIKNKDNIYMVMVVKLLYTLIPLTVMLVGASI